MKRAPKDSAKRAHYTFSAGPSIRAGIGAMGAAFLDTCSVLGLTARSDPITTLVAEKIIELAERGVRNPTAMRSMALDELKSDRN